MKLILARERPGTVVLISWLMGWKYDINPTTLTGSRVQGILLGLLYGKRPREAHMTSPIAAILLVVLTLAALWGWRDGIRKTEAGTAELLKNIAASLRKKGLSEANYSDDKLSWSERGTAQLLVRVHSHFDDDGASPEATFTCSMPIEKPIPLKLCRRLNTTSPVVHAIVGRGVTTGNPSFDKEWKLTSSNPEAVMGILGGTKVARLMGVLNSPYPLQLPTRMEIRRGRIHLHGGTYCGQAEWVEAALLIIEQARACRDWWEQNTLQS